MPRTRYEIRDVEGGYVDSGTVEYSTGPSTEEVVGKAADITGDILGNIFFLLIAGIFKLLFGSLMRTGITLILIGTLIGVFAGSHWLGNALLFGILGICLLGIGYYRRGRRERQQSQSRK